MTIDVGSVTLAVIFLVLIIVLASIRDRLKDIEERQKEQDKRFWELYCQKYPQDC